MADVIQPATSGRSKCRGCGRKIESGELRFGETLANPYAEGETQYWFHLLCAACMRPEKALPAIEACALDVPERPWLVAAATLGAAHRRLPRLLHVERSKSGKARCRSCREVIAGGVLRFALQMFEEGRRSPIGFIHVECAKAYFGTEDIEERVRKLTPELDDPTIAELRERLSHQRAATPDSEEPHPGDATPRAADETTGPDVAKARPVEGVAPGRARNSGT